jgi:MinD superfamily P-loop ATPase
MKQLVVLSGKGGTGKTTVTAAIADLANRQQYRLVLADADVDAANLALLLAPNGTEAHTFLGGELAQIDDSSCEACGACGDVCRFEAIVVENGQFSIDPLACEGCGACQHVCPSDAITLEIQRAGEWFRSGTNYGPLFHAELEPGEENSGKLVALLKQHARLEALDRGYDGVLVDGPPGIGCPVISAVSGADAALIVTEPTAAGVHDLGRIVGTARHFDIPVWVCINKSDLLLEGARLIQNYCAEAGITILGEIPFDPVIVEAMEHVQPVTSYAFDSPASNALSTLYALLQEVLFESEQYG